MQKKKAVQFPKHFLWGAAVSAHQVEGKNTNQWSVWELENAKSLAAQAEYTYGHFDNWKTIKSEASKPDTYISGNGVDHYAQFQDDIALMKKLHLTAFRFSIEWSRIEPTEGAWDAGALNYYKQYIRALKTAGIEPIVTLFHFTLPVWFAEKGGFERRRNIDDFIRYVEKVMQEFGTYIKYVITINEPMIYTQQSYYEAAWPPQVHSKRSFLQVIHNLATAHNRSVDIIKTINRRIRVSVAYNSAYYYGGDDAWLTHASTGVMQYLSDDYFLRLVVKKCDFLGVNYYFSNRVYGYRVHNPDKQISDIGWEVEPENIEFVLERLYKKYKLPLMITENGVADADDMLRQAWLVKTIAAMQRAVNDHKVEVLGYLHWSLLDNFEWAHGWWPKFGLIAVDRTTMQRTLRPSARWYGRFIKHIID